MAKVINSFSKGFRAFVFGESENSEQEQFNGKVFVNAPKSRVKFEAELKTEDDYDRAINLLVNEKKIQFPKS